MIIYDFSQCLWELVYATILYHCLVYVGDVSNLEDTLTSIHFTLVKKGLRKSASITNWSTSAVKVSLHSAG